MTTFRHILGLSVAVLLGAALWAAWTYFPDFTGWKPIRPYRGYLVEWRLPIFAVGGFLILTLAEWLYGLAFHRQDHDEP
ncbi:hypothetical protein EOI86_13740 [Hwanghaeella grinnelliae]|uniref:Uncharacterized protein n=1 Tax=Hwanghaeella grinnelliae TaxID=2500179 RepID=A0A437QP90_9PROT|nr:hypothetical protein [Hwanghaeella grinnelliae]RVU36274.1 hypothetical protein EOI86_13740 [Hwanghaeella grinnelliae]